MGAEVKPANGFGVIEGGRLPLSTEQRRAVSFFADVVRGLSREQIDALIQLIHEFHRDNYLERLRPFEVPAIKILAEVLNGWDNDGVHEFTRAWVSTLVSRQDGFNWNKSDSLARSDHQSRVDEEMARRGLSVANVE